MSADFGYRERIVQRDQVVGIYDLVGFTRLDSNQDLVQAVRMMETELEFGLEDFTWDRRTYGQIEKETNDVLLRSTGDGYVVAFSQGMDDLEALNYLKGIHSRIDARHRVRLGINKGKNYVLTDINARVNIVGWGINLAARALQFADDGQIICTEYLAKPLLQTNKATRHEFRDLGKNRIKNITLRLYEYVG